MSKAAQNRARVVMIGTTINAQGGVSSVVGVLKEAGLFDQCGLEYISTHRGGGAGDKLTILLGAWFNFLAMLLRGRVALIHAHTASRASFWRKSLFIVPALLARVPVILHLHGAEFQIFYGQECSAFSRRFVRWVFEGVSQVVVLSESWQQWVRTTFPQAKVRVIPNPINVPTLQTNHSQTRSPHKLLFLGRLGKRKGVYDLLQAAATLVSHHPQLRLLLGGDGELDAVRAQAEALGIGGHVELLGWVSGADKSRLLNEAAIYVLPSYNEGLPMSVLEAMAYGLPIVSTPIGGIPDAVRDGKEGYLVAPGDVEALADRLDRLLTDVALRAHMGEAAHARALSHFDATGIVEQWLKLYRELAR